MNRHRDSIAQTAKRASSPRSVGGGSTVSENRTSLRRLHLLSTNSTSCVLFAWCVSTAVAFTILMVCGIPSPMIHDEFGYLLGADTFASGRLTNPSHPMWEHFESFHIFGQPSYNSKYPPGQTIVLALGQLLGHPIVGVCLSTGLAIATLVWMLTGWLPRRYFWLATLFAVAHPGLHFTWGQSYWGAAVPLMGASLLLGSLARLRQRNAVFNSLIAGCGIVLLANSRPFEGAVLTLAVAIGVVARCYFERWQLRQFAMRVALPALAVIGLGASQMLVYNQTVTGSAWKLPYSVHEETYGWNKLFVWQSAGEKPDYRHPMMERFFQLDRADVAHKYRSTASAIGQKWNASLLILRFYCGAAFIVTAIGLPLMWRRTGGRLAILLLVPAFAAGLATPWNWPHYAAPAAPLLSLVFLGSVIEIWRHAKKVPLVQLSMVLLLPMLQVIWFFGTANGYVQLQQNGWGRKRTAIAKRLESEPGKDLVLVRYAADHNPNAEWVYNPADLDDAEVLWAREMNAAKRSQLLGYFADRNIWVVEPDHETPLLYRYDPANTLPCKMSPCTLLPSQSE